METFRFTLKPDSAFGTPLVGDTLFGQLCWTLRDRFGNDKLESLLQGYKNNKPFVVLSDAFPAGYIPLPTIPKHFWETSEENNRKILKTKRWLDITKLELPVTQWQQVALSDKEIMASEMETPLSLHELRTRSHNTINRMTSTTGKDEFAPYTQSQIWYNTKLSLHCYAVLDEARLTLDELTEALKIIGLTGYGRDASIGLGKFHVTKIEKWDQWPLRKGTTCLTLAPCAPQSLNWNACESYYRIHTRFGRHGNIAARGTNPFKRPLLMAQTGAVFTLNKESHSQWIGQGIGNVSFTDPQSVHQGYAPVIYLPSFSGKTGNE